MELSSESTQFSIFYFGVDHMDKEPLLFRKKSLDRISQPDQLTDYLRVSKPMVWLLLGAILSLLTGIFIWSLIGNIDIMTDGYAVVEDGQATVMLTNNEKYQLNNGMRFTINGKDETISGTDKNDFGMIVGYAEVLVSDGNYPVSVVVKSSRPYELLFGV